MNANAKETGLSHMEMETVIESYGDGVIWR